LFSVLLNEYIEILEAVEKRSRKRGVDGDVSLFAIEYLPSLNVCNIQISQHHSFAPGEPIIKQAHRQVRVDVCFFVRCTDHRIFV
jgi:hypothetical protein